MLIYAFPWLMFSGIKANEPVRVIADDFKSAATILSENNVYGYCELLTALFIKGLNIIPSSNVPSYLLRIFAGNDLRKYLTDIGRGAYDAVLQNAYSIIEQDFEECHVNYLYQMYDYEEGVISAQQAYNLTYTVKAEYKSYGFNYPELGVMFPVNNSKREQYLQLLMREAENMYRRNAGLQGVGEGWVSETLLFRRIEAAFPDTTVVQHQVLLF